jgi:hypothetical protein
MTIPHDRHASAYETLFGMFILVAILLVAGWLPWWAAGWLLVLGWVAGFANGPRSCGGRSVQRRFQRWFDASGRWLGTLWSLLTLIILAAWIIYWTTQVLT